MQLKALKITSLRTGEDLVWKFSQGTSSGSNLLVFNESSSDLSEILENLECAFDTDKVPPCESMSIKFADDRGINWTWERKQRNFKLFREQKLIESSELAKTMIASLFDTDLDQKSNPSILLVDIKASKESLSAEIRDDRLNTSTKMAKALQEKRLELWQSLDKVLPFSANQSSSAKLSFVDKAEGYFYSHETLSKQLKAFSGQSASDEDSSATRLEQVKKELDLIHQLEEHAKPLLDPANNPRLLREKIEKIESKIASINAEMSLTRSDLLEEKIPWHKLATCLGNRMAQEILLSASDKALDFYHDKIEPVEGDYLGHLSKLLEEDSEILSKLESMLQTLSQTEQKLAEPSHAKKAINLVSKFIKPEVDQAGKPRPEDLLPLAQAKRLVDLVLTKFSRLHVRLAELTQTPKTSLEALKEFHEKISQDIQSTQNTWKKYCERYGISLDITLEGLIALTGHHCTIVALESEKQKLLSLQNQRRASLTKLESMLKDWRAITSSQKGTDLANSSVLTSEAQAVLRQKESKIHQIQKIESDLAQRSTEEAIRASYQQKIKRLNQEWEKTTLSTLSAPVPLMSSVWPEAFAAARKIEALTELYEDSHIPISSQLSNLFAEPDTLAPVVLYRLDDENMDTKASLRLVEQLESQKKSCTRVFFTSRSDLTATLSQLGSGFAQRVLVQRHQAASGLGANESVISQKSFSKHASPTVDSSGVLSMRAQEALSILTRKR